MNQEIILLSGMKGSGKSTISSFLASEFDFNILRLGGYIDSYLQNLGLEVNEKNKSFYSKKLLEESEVGSMIYYYSNDLLGNSGKFVIDSIISMKDLDYFKTLGLSASLWYVHLDDDKRYKRLVSRNRSDDVDILNRLSDFEKKNLPEVTAFSEIADISILNSGSIGELEEKIFKLIKN